MYKNKGTEGGAQGDGSRSTGGRFFCVPIFGTQKNRPPVLLCSSSLCRGTQKNRPLVSSLVSIVLFVYPCPCSLNVKDEGGFLSAGNI